MDPRNEKKAFYLVNKKSGLVVSSMELMSEKEAETRNERLLAFISETIEWVSSEEIDKQYARIDWDHV